MNRPALIAALAVCGLAAACGSRTEAPEPANEDIAAAMPETPDRSDTAADEKGLAVEQAPQGTAPDAGAQPGG